MDLSKYIGRNYESYNCFDLVREFYKDQYGLELKNYFDGEVVPSRQEIECLVKTNIGVFDPVRSPKFGDLVVVNLYGYASHIGVCIGEGRFIHSLRNVGSCMDSLARYAKMTEGFYRHREIAQ